MVRAIQSRSLAWSESKGHLFLDARREALHRMELVRNRKTREPMAPFNGTCEEMAALGKFFREQGLYTLVRWNSFYTNPPLCINEQQLREAFAIIDNGLEITDRAVKD